MSVVAVISNGGDVREFNVASGTTESIKPGYPVKISGNDAAALATGDPEIGVDRMIGIAVSTSTETASAAGTVSVEMVVPNATVLRADATTPANLAAGILLDSVTFDLSSGSYTIDEDEGDDPDVHGLMILGYDADNGTVDFMLKTGASISGEIA